MDLFGKLNVALTDEQLSAFAGERLGLERATVFAATVHL